MLVLNAEKSEKTIPLQNTRAINDLLKNAKLKLTSVQVKGFNQKLIDLCYKLGYYINNESIFVEEESKEEPKE